MNRPETIEETAELVAAAGGHGIAVPTDHLEQRQVAALASRIGQEHGRVDILVNDIWGSDPLTAWGQPFWEHSLVDGLRLLRLGVETHITTSWYLAQLLLKADAALVVEITDGVDSSYRGNFFYDLAKAQVIRLAFAQAAELDSHGATALALTPGFLRSEAMLDGFGVTEANWRDATTKDPNFAVSETPTYVGRAVAAVACDLERHRWHGQAVSSWQLAKHYGFCDSDGSQPDWGRWYRDVIVDKQSGDPNRYR